MNKVVIRAIKNPVELLMAQIYEIRRGNTDTQNEIDRLRNTLRGGQREEVRLQKKLDKLLAARKD